MKSLPKVVQEPETLPFRSETQTVVVADATFNTVNLTGLRHGGVKVSEYRLEQFLNACNPTCHG